jgi:hypothetical protein
MTISVVPDILQSSLANVLSSLLVMESSRCNLVRKTLETLNYPQEFFSPKDDSKAPYLVYECTNSNGQKLFSCHLCREGLLDALALEHHCLDSRHQDQLYSLKEDVDIVRAISGRACRLLHGAAVRSELDSLDKVPRSASTDAIHAELYKYLMGPSSNANEDETNESAQLYPPLKKLRLCLQNERLVLVGLAVWKAKCIQEMPTATMNYFAAQEWMQSGWKSAKKAQYDSNAMAIITSAVKPFLKDESRFVGIFRLMND